MIDRGRLTELFDYGAEAGVLIWKERPAASFPSAAASRTFASRFQGRVAGSINSDGYRRVKIDGRSYMVHRLVWLFMTGKFLTHPNCEIDHINHDRSDNRIENLRRVTRVENARNISMGLNNTSGVPGVYWHKPSQKWCASIKHESRNKHLGRFADMRAAKEARAAAEIAFGYHANHGMPAPKPRRGLYDALGRN